MNIKFTMRMIKGGMRALDKDLRAMTNNDYEEALRAMLAAIDDNPMCVIDMPIIMLAMRKTYNSYCTTRSPQFKRECKYKLLYVFNTIDVFNCDMSTLGDKPSDRGFSRTEEIVGTISTDVKQMCRRILTNILCDIAQAKKSKEDKENEDE